ncbi:hypothetical protein E4U09_004102 [Claviceps aff. purpurea]|uniref:Uncharacterized protein n=1 Tax=Claviceps aff. purpurea TaxID=1967640 RepID=A0A9P7TZZ5_9HYPO|nr:hypothetical protein E4U09_004102 [Claviceps aff. purpurea]
MPTTHFDDAACSRKATAVKQEPLRCRLQHLRLLTGETCFYFHQGFPKQLLLFEIESFSERALWTSGTGLERHHRAATFFDSETGAIVFPLQGRKTDTLYSVFGRTVWTKGRNIQCASGSFGRPLVGPQPTGDSPKRNGSYVLGC